MRKETKTLAQRLDQLRTFADDQERIGIYDCRNLSTDGLRATADKIGEAWKLEREALAPEPDPNWKAICAKCHDGEIEPECEYYGEPNGCNSPIYGEHPKSSAAMRDALALAVKILFAWRRDLPYRAWHEVEAMIDTCNAVLKEGGAR